MFSSCLNHAGIILVVRTEYSATNDKLLRVILTPNDEDVVFEAFRYTSSDVRHGKLAINHFDSVEL